MRLVIKKLLLSKRKEVASAKGRPRDLVLLVLLLLSLQEKEEEKVITGGEPSHKRLRSGF